MYNYTQADMITVIISPFAKLIQPVMKTDYHFI